MVKEAGEKRVFLPDLVQRMAGWGLSVYLEEGYGATIGHTFADYQLGHAAIHRCSRAQAFAQDIVLLLRSPNREEFDALQVGSCLVAMLHFPTRPWRVAKLQELGIDAISLDSIVNDEGVRLVENMQAVAWNGLETAFTTLEQLLPGLTRSDGQPVQVLLLGSGLVGTYAVPAAIKFGDPLRHDRYLAMNHPGVLVRVAGRSVTSQNDLMHHLLSETDILVDATARRDPSQPVIPNPWIRWLPQHAVIADLAVDPYLLQDTPPVVRGIEGIPRGDLDQYVFLPDDPHWNDMVPPGIPSAERRAVVSCYSWPGIHPVACMAHYGR